MRDPAVADFLGAPENAVADTQRSGTAHILSPSLSTMRSTVTLGIPPILWNNARPGALSISPLVAHTLEQRLERDLVLRIMQAESAYDLASHTSSASSKPIHGSLHYLETWEFRLVHEALHERECILAARRI